MKMCLLTKKCTYWMKMCLLTKNLSIEWKYAYWLKMCPLNENFPIDRKMCLLKNENAQLFGVFKRIGGIILCSHVAQ